MGKRVTGHFFLDSVAEETHACNYLLAVDMEMEPVPGYEAASWELGYGDFVIKPDMNTLRRIPWLDGTALVIGDVLDHHHTPVPHAPRNILKQQLARLTERGWTAYMASELEFHLLDESYEAARERRYHGMKYASWYAEDYHIFQTTKEEGLIRALRNNMDACGIPIETSKGEWSPGQEEINFKYAEALDMADRHSIYKNGAKEIAFLQGKAVSFMAKVGYDLAGNSCHIHSSLWDTKSNTPLFHDKDAEHGMSKLFRHYLAGQLALAKEMTYCFAPNINSYKRFQSGTFAPTKAAWSLDNPHRRLPGHHWRRRHPDRVPHPRRRLQPLPGLRRDPGRRALRHRQRARAARGLRGQHVRRQARARRAQDPARGGGRPLRPCRRVGATRVRPPDHRLGADPQLRTGLTETPFHSYCTAPRAGIECRRSNLKIRRTGR